MRLHPGLVSAAITGLVVGLLAVSAPPASATATGVEVSLEDTVLYITGHPSPVGATEEQLSGDIRVIMVGSVLGVSVDPDSGGPQLWTTDPKCSPNTGVDVMQIMCYPSDPRSVSAVVDMTGVDEEGSNRTFIVKGPIETEFYGSEFGDYFEGGTGDDYFEGGDGPDNLIGGGGVDTVVGGPGPDSIDVKDAALDEATADEVDCNDEDSRGTDNDPDEGETNEVEFNPNDSITDCGIRGAPVNISPPAISGDLQVGVAVTADPGEWEGRDLSFTYQWTICPTADEEETDFENCWSSDEVQGKSGLSYTPSTKDAGHYVSITVTATNDLGEADAVSDFVGPVVDVPAPEPTNPLPHFSDTTPIEGQALKVNTGGWSVRGGDKLTYVVSHCYKRQSGTIKCREQAAGSSKARKWVAYTPTEDNVGNWLQATVTVTRQVDGTSGSRVLTTSRSTEMTDAVEEIGKAPISMDWVPSYDDQRDRYFFTNLSEVQKWLTTWQSRVPMTLNVVRVGLPTILGSKAYQSLRKYRQDLPLNDQAVLAINEGDNIQLSGASVTFGDSVKGYPGMDRKTVSVLVYDKMLDLDSCAAALKQASWTQLAKGDALRDVTSLLSALKCPDWRIEWSPKISRDTVSRVESVRVASSVSDGVTTNTIVVTANEPRVGGVFMTLAPMLFEESEAYPETSTLTWDGDIKSGLRSSFAVWPMLAATGQSFYGGRSSSVELFDVDGRRISTVEFGSWKKVGPISMSGVFPEAGTARVLLRVVDSDSSAYEVFADIPVRAPSGAFGTLDGRCLNGDASPASACPATPAAAESMVAALKTMMPGFASSGLSDFEVLRAGAGYEGKTPMDSNYMYALNLANGTFQIGGTSARSGRVSPRACEGTPFAVLCKGWDQLVSAVGWVMAQPVEVPEPDSGPDPEPIQVQPLPPVKEPIQVPALFIGGPNEVFASVSSSGGCQRLGFSVPDANADFALACTESINAGGVPIALQSLDADVLANLEQYGALGTTDRQMLVALYDKDGKVVGAQLINLDGGSLINLDGGSLKLINLDGGSLIARSQAYLENPVLGLERMHVALDMMPLSSDLGAG